jgi:hypothetical protein
MCAKATRETRSRDFFVPGPVLFAATSANIIFSDPSNHFGRNFRANSAQLLSFGLAPHRPFFLVNTETMADYNKQTVAQLKKLLKDRGIPSTGLTRKAQIVEKVGEEAFPSVGVGGVMNVVGASERFGGVAGICVMMRLGAVPRSDGVDCVCSPVCICGGDAWKGSSNTLVSRFLPSFASYLFCDNPYFRLVFLCLHTYPLGWRPD